MDPRVPSGVLSYTLICNELTLPIALRPHWFSGGTDLQLAVEDDILEEARRLLLVREGCGKARARGRLLAHGLAVGS